MEKEVKNLFNEQILEESASRFGIDTSTLNLLGSFQNYVYEYKRQNKSYILRLTHSSHRKEDLVKGELDWILYLVNNGVSASRPVYSIHGKLTEKIDIDDSYFIATSFEKAEGKKIGYPECLSNDELFEECGRATGKIHFLSKKYRPSSKEIQRHEWRENYYLKNIKKYIPDDQHKVYESYESIVNRINQLNKESDSFGLIHGDINVGNFLLSDKVINIFDFDECQYSWFVEDIAIQLFYIIYVFLDDSIEERQAQTYGFMENFMKGYYKENYIDEYWLKQIPIFLQLRELIVYIGLQRSVDFSNMNQWMENYISQSKLRIEQKIPIVNEIIKS
ncbi:Ser/Thr protein kinase RdoA involved in Cpx stress response, MazF antagonist [Clostridium frigidicarnis]|uniref:Ser/Thr protein kinase RdoA involved in Cpx stress response, MazF antagonist n=1 Tax=Clostridium frigidicarnis TaxID=84698 RepID=A0A1I0YA98_9CLOT|nr:phosphotransferase [Clostridium frigidicarnis]SFB10191.1 Ser/Thr protein kinase RdoA involved in Cpx stress response, MazF antagonist [Clostridium frigidicarnis]